MDDVLAKVELPRRRFTVEEFHRMGEAGVFTEKERVELIDGEIVQMSPIGPQHAASVGALTQRLILALGGRAVLHPQSPVRLSRRSEPQPDIVLVRPPESRYWRQAPEPKDVVLLVEVADTSYEYDRDVKLRLYATAGVFEYWIVDLPGGGVDVHREPGPKGYRTVYRFERGATVAVGAFPDVVLTVSELLPPR